MPKVAAAIKGSLTEVSQQEHEQGQMLSPVTPCLLTTFRQSKNNSSPPYEPHHQTHFSLNACQPIQIAAWILDY